MAKKTKTKVTVDDDNVVEMVEVEKKKIPKTKWIIALIFLVCVAGFYYLNYPTLNYQSKPLYTGIMFIIFALGIIFADIPWTADSAAMNDAAKRTRKPGKTKLKDTFIMKDPAFRIMVIAELILFVALFIGNLCSSELFNAKKYASLIDLEESSFADEIMETENIQDIAIMDTATARILGSRTIGSLSDVVSQYEVSNAYSTIDYKGRPMKVATLNYAGLVKWFNNRGTGIPGYVIVDPVTNEAKYVSLNQGMRYTPSGYFGDNLMRHVQFQYPTTLFEGCYFELDNEGNPYYICPTLKANAGLFGAKDVKGAVICDPITGDCTYYAVNDIPTWVDRVYDGDLATRKYDWYGMLSGGYWNSVIGNKGCKVTTDDYGYKVIDGDVYVYTGVTSVNSDESNVGFVLMNLRTGKSKYFAMSGAEEYSAMSSAQGQVQHLGYAASFPSLINISGEATYIMAMKDGAGLVKMYALVNVQNYNIVATGKTQNEALAEYKKLMAANHVGGASTIDEEVMKEARVTVKDIQFITMEDQTYVYIKDASGNVYKQAFAENESLILISVDDVINVTYMESPDGIHQLYSYTK